MRKNENGFGALEILIAISFIGLLGVIGWLVWDRQHSTKNSSDKIVETSKSITEPEDVTKLIRKYLGTKYNISTYTNANTSSDEINELVIDTSESAPLQKVDGYDFYSSYKGGSTMYISAYYKYEEYKTLPTEYDKAVRALVSNKLTDLGFTKKSTSINYTAEYRKYIEFKGRGIVCIAEDENMSSTSTYLSCGKIDQYEAAAAIVKPFADITPESLATTSFSNLNISDSTISGYQKAEIDRCNDVCDVALYYKIPNSNQWKFFKTTQAALLCSDYNNNDLKKAFSGEQCHVGDGTESTVNY